tara:strand:+ start:34 stop:219 length:186 start_codon:yes stop_codon:yes gene_type:complete
VPEEGGNDDFEPIGNQVPVDSEIEHDVHDVHDVHVVVEERQCLIKVKSGLKPVLKALIVRT